MPDQSNHKFVTNDLTVLYRYNYVEGGNCPLLGNQNQSFYSNNNLDGPGAMFFNAGCDKQECFLLNPEYILAQIRLVLFKKNAKTT